MEFGTLFEIMGGIGLFLYGAKLMSNALQDMAGDKMRTLIASLTGTPFRGAITGALVTMVIQSSAATTIMSVSFVQAGMMTLKQALGVIMGANIGTTVTAQLVAFKISQLSYPLVGIGMLLSVFGKTKRQKYVGDCLFGLGLLFVGMKTMEHALSFLADKKEFFLLFARNPLLCVMAGTLLTMAVQSSSATVGLTIAMATQGLLPLESSIAIMFGDNLGTTITTVLAALGASRQAKQAAAGHVLFNLIGVAIFLPLLRPYCQLMTLTSDEIARQIANAHTCFNVFNTMIQLPLVNVIAKLIQKLIPAGDEGKLVYTGARFLDERLIQASPAAAVTAVRNELVHMGEMALSMLDCVKKAFCENDTKSVALLHQTEQGLDDLNRRIAAYAAQLWHSHTSSDLAKMLESLVNGATDIERIGDHAEGLMETYEYQMESKTGFSPAATQEFIRMLDHVSGMLQMALQAVKTEHVDLALEVARVLEPQNDQLEKDLRHKHIDRLTEGVCTPEVGVIFIDSVTGLERVGDHATNIAEIVLDKAGLLHKSGTNERKA